MSGAAQESRIAPRWRADLQLAFERRGERTVLARNLHRGPLQVQKALYPESDAICHIAVLHPPGGIAAGDELCLRACLGERSSALLTTPGATKWYRSEATWASQNLHFSLGEAAILEWLPRENIFFDGSRAALGLEVDLAAGAMFFGWDIHSFGRRASDESWRSGKLRLSTRISRADRMIWSEVADLEADSGFVRSAVGLCGCTVCGTFVVAAPGITAEMLAECRTVTPAERTSRVGLTRLPGLLIARYLGDCGEDAFQWFTRLWALLRPALAGRAAHPPRLWAC